MNKDFIKWLKDYDNLRTDPDGINNIWVSSKYDISGLPWKDVSEIEIIELPDQEGNPMKFGQACSALKKTWQLFNTQRRSDGIYRGDLAFRIIQIQRAMGIKESHFPELDKEWVDHELTLEEKELKREEQEESGWNIEDPEEEEEEDEDWENW